VVRERVLGEMLGSVNDSTGGGWKVLVMDAFTTKITSAAVRMSDILDAGGMRVAASSIHAVMGSVIHSGAGGWKVLVISTVSNKILSAAVCMSDTPGAGTYARIRAGVQGYKQECNRTRQKQSALSTVELRLQCMLSSTVVQYYSGHIMPYSACCACLVPVACCNTQAYLLQRTWTKLVSRCH
jgi:hypothetical protein